MKRKILFVFLALCSLLYGLVVYAGTTTTHVGLYKPAYGESGSTWWSNINSNFDKLDRTGPSGGGSYTTGSVVFSKASGILGQDNSSLFWDDANDRLGIKTATPHSNLQVAGSVAVNLITSASTYTMLDTDAVILCNAASGAQTVNLLTAAGRTGRILLIKKSDSSGNACTMDPAGTETVNGSTTYSLATQHKYVVIISDNANWHIFANN